MTDDCSQHGSPFVTGAASHPGINTFVKFLDIPATSSS
jgi:hypothetical protein